MLEHLPSRREPRVIGLSVGYRIPQQIMNLANRVMAAAAPGFRAQILCVRAIQIRTSS